MFLVYKTNAASSEIIFGAVYHKYLVKFAAGLSLVYPSKGSEEFISKIFSRSPSRFADEVWANAPFQTDALSSYIHKDNVALILYLLLGTTAL